MEIINKKHRLVALTLWIFKLLRNSQAQRWNKQAYHCAATYLQKTKSENCKQNVLPPCHSQTV